DTVEEAIERAEIEALDTDDDAVRAPMLLRAAELTFRYGSRDAAGLTKSADYLAQILKAEASTLASSPGVYARALNLAAAVYETQERWTELADVLERKASSAPAKEERIGAANQLALLHRTRLDDERAAVEAHAFLLDLDPGNRVALGFLVDH